MTPEQQANLDIAAEFLGLDEFQKIAIAALIPELEGRSFPADAEHQRLLIELGAIVDENFMRLAGGG